MIYSFKTSEKIRLDEFLRQKIPQEIKKECSNSKIRRLILSGEVYVNSKQIRRPAFELRGKSEIKINFEEEKFFYEKTPDDIKFELTEENVLFEDEYLICVNKPAFFPVEETIVGNEKRDNLHQAVIRYLWNKNQNLRNPPYVGIMHRLDRETSGIILFTKKREVNKPIQKMFETHEFTKIYTAICTKNKNVNLSESELKHFTVEFPMNRISGKTQKAKWGFVPKEKGGLDSKTNFTLIEEINQKGINFYKFRAELFTGRTHQIRVHLSSKGFPILGDTNYGGLESKRIMLHSTILEFIHPITKENIRIECKFDEKN